MFDRALVHMGEKLNTPEEVGAYAMSFSPLIITSGLVALSGDKEVTLTNVLRESGITDLAAELTRRSFSREAQAAYASDLVPENQTA